MKIIVTGGAGFIGSHVVDRYISLGHSVAVIDNLFTGKKKQVHPKARFYNVDIRDKAQIPHIFAKEKPDILNHHAAQMDVRKSVADPGSDADINILGLINLLQAGKTSGITKVIFASSGGAIYGDASVLPTPESYLPRPASPYGISKLTSEYYLDFYWQTYHIPFVALRYGNVYGPRQNPHGEAGVVAIFTRKMLNNEQVFINGTGEQSRDFVYVSDVAEANSKALEISEPLRVNIGTGKNTSVNQVYDVLARETATTIIKMNQTAKPGEQQISQLDIALAHQKLGWQPHISLLVGLQETVTYFKNEKE